MKFLFLGLALGQNPYKLRVRVPFCLHTSRF